MLGFSMGEVLVIGIVAFLTLKIKDLEDLGRKVGIWTYRLDRIRTHLFKFLSPSHRSALSPEHLDLLRKEVELRIKQVETPSPISELSHSSPDPMSNPSSPPTKAPSFPGLP